MQSNILSQNTLSPRLIIGFLAAIMVHAALLISFPKMESVKTIHAAMQAGSTILQISIAPAKEPVAKIVPVKMATAKPVPIKRKKVVTKAIAVKPVKREVAKTPTIKASAMAVKTVTKAVSIPVVTKVSLKGQRVAPEYPKRALRLKQEGTVILKVLVDAVGRQQEIQVTRSSQYQSLDRAALKAVSKWRFKPTTRGNETILSWVQIPVEFKIQ